MVLLGKRVTFSNCNISSNESLCIIDASASNAVDVINSMLRRKMNVSCVWSSSWRLSLFDGVDVERRYVSVACDLFLVSLLHVVDPTRGVTSGWSLTVEWLAE